MLQHVAAFTLYNFISLTLWHYY